MFGTFDIILLLHVRSAPGVPDGNVGQSLLMLDVCKVMVTREKWETREPRGEVTADHRWIREAQTPDWHSRIEDAADNSANDANVQRSSGCKRKTSGDTRKATGPDRTRLDHQNGHRTLHLNSWHLQPEWRRTNISTLLSSHDESCWTLEGQVLLENTVGEEGRGHDG